jgi:hypothetical protein
LDSKLAFSALTGRKDSHVERHNLGTSNIALANALHLEVGAAIVDRIQHIPKKVFVRL